jgi:hypothetical protein
LTPALQKRNRFDTYHHLFKKYTNVHWLMLVILAIREVEINRIMVQTCLDINVTLSQKITKAKRAGESG